MTSIAIASGKGGTGKSVFSASLASAFAGRGLPTILFDADLGVGNAHILHGVTAERTAAHVVAGRETIQNVVVDGPHGVRVVPGGSGVAGMATLSSYELHLLGRALARLEDPAVDLLMADAGAGISAQTIRFLAAADLVVLVTTPDLTALTDAYALIKVLVTAHPRTDISLVVNRVHNPEEGLGAADRICQTARRFLGVEVRYIGSMPEDAEVQVSVADRVPFLVRDPHSPAAAFVRYAAETLEAVLATRAAGGTSYGTRLSGGPRRGARLRSRLSAARDALGGRRSVDAAALSTN